MEHTRKEIQLLLGASALLLFLEILPIFLLPESTNQSRQFAGSEISTSSMRISDLEGQPSLGGAAVMVVNEGEMLREVPLCASLPEQAFAILLLVYVLLLAFNLRESYTSKGRPGGVFEIILTGAFIVLWACFDGCRTAAWFPLLTIKTGLILYIFAAVIALEEKKSDTSSLF